MKSSVIVGVSIALLVVAIVLALTVVNVNAQQEVAQEETSYEAAGSCGNTCTAGSNCGNPTCGVVAKTGGCGCGRS